MSTPQSPENSHIMSLIAKAGSAGLTVNAIHAETGYRKESIRDCIKNAVAGKKLVSLKVDSKIQNAKAYAVIVKMTTPVVAKRQSTLSPERQRIEALLKVSTQPLTTIAISKRADVDLERTRKILQTMREFGQATNINNPRHPQWRLSASVNAEIKAASALSMDRLCNGTSKGLYVPLELRPFDGRPGAMDAYRIPSLGLGT